MPRVSPFTEEQVYKNLIKRFWSKVNKQGTVPSHCPELGSCWEWTACKKSKGRGQIGVRIAGVWRMITASRVAWFLKTGEWSKVFVCHKCDNPACVRFSHFFEGTNADNMADCAAKGRKIPKIRQTHCKRGHNLNMAYVNPRGARVCRKCRKLRQGSE